MPHFSSLVSTFHSQISALLILDTRTRISMHLIPNAHWIDRPLLIETISKLKIQIPALFIATLTSCLNVTVPKVQCIISC